MADKLDTHEGRDTGLHPRPSQEHEEQPRAVKEDKVDEADEAHYCVALLGDKLGDDDEEHVVAVDAEETHGDGSKVVQIVQGKKLPLGLITRDQEDDLDQEDENLDDEEEDGGEEDEVEGAPGDGGRPARDAAHKWRRS